MTMPDTGTDGMTAQILLRLGEISTQLAVMAETLKALPDHEQRLRVLEAANTTAQAESTASKDGFARLVASGAGLAAVGSAVASWLHR